MAGGGRRRGGRPRGMGKWPETGNGTEEEAGEGRNFEGGGREKKKLAFKAFFSLSSLFFSLTGRKKSTKKTCFAFSSRVAGGGAVGDGLCNARSLLAAPPCFVQIFQGHDGISGGRERRRAKKAGVYSLQRGRLANSAATSGAATKKHEHTHIIREARQSLLCVAPPPLPIAL